MLHWFDYVLIAIIVALLGWAIWYIRRQGKGCSGCASCPYTDSCKKLSANRKPRRGRKDGTDER